LGKQRLTLYVKSSRNFVSRTVDVEKVTVQNWGSTGGTGPSYRAPLFGSPYHDTFTKTKTDLVLPDDQKRIVEMVKEIASKLGLEVEVVDVAKENALHKAIKREPKITTYPTLMTDSGEKIEGELTKEQVKPFLSRVH
jgi:glutaredoxin